MTSPHPNSAVAHSAPSRTAALAPGDGIPPSVAGGINVCAVHTALDSREVAQDHA